jgi:hypothetical protein
MGFAVGQVAAAKGVRQPFTTVARGTSTKHVDVTQQVRTFVAK